MLAKKGVQTDAYPKRGFRSSTPPIHEYYVSLGKIGKKGISMRNVSPHTLLLRAKTKVTARNKAPNDQGNKENTTQQKKRGGESFTNWCDAHPDAKVEAVIILRYTY